MQARNRPLDNQDRAIMRALQKNARLSNAELAEVVGMSTTACWNRTRQLEADGYIRGYVALLDQQKLGFADVVLIEVRLDRHDDDALGHSPQPLDVRAALHEEHSVGAGLSAQPLKARTARSTFRAPPSRAPHACAENRTPSA